MAQTDHTRPSDAAFKDLLKDYAAPVKDNGFSDSVLQEINLREPTSPLTWRKTCLSLAAFTGGLIAAKQLPALSKLGGQAAALTPASDIGALLSFNLSLYTLTGLFIFTAFALWSIFEPLIDM